VVSLDGVWLLIFMAVFLNTIFKRGAGIAQSV
jgi:hypothetical protein